MYKYDIVVIILIVIIITVIFLINIKKMLNDKLTNIEIKLPEIDVKQPNITVNVQRECSSDKYDVYFNNDAKKEPKLLPKSENTEHFEQTPITTFPKTSQENYSKTSQENYLKVYQENYSKTSQENYLKASQEDFQENFPKVFQEDYYLFYELNIPKTDSENAQNDYQNNAKNDYQKKIINIQQNNLNREPLIHPQSAPNIVSYPDNTSNYNDFICMKKEEFDKINIPASYKIYDPNEIKNHNKRIVKLILENDNYDQDDEYDSLEYFLKNRQFIPTSFEDGATKGYNIGEYNDYGGLNDIGKIKLGKTLYKNPKPSNFI